MRIAHVNQDAGVTPSKKKGAAVHVEAMRQAFRQSGAEVLALDEVDDGALVAELGRLHAIRPIDLIYERHALHRYAAGGFARSAGVPHVLEVNAPLAEEEARWRAGTRAPVDAEAERALFRGATRILAVSTAVGRYCVDRGAPSGRVVVTPNAVDPMLFRPRAADDPLRAELVPAGRLALGFHGRLRPWHNFTLLVRATQRLLARGVPVHLLIVGEGDFEPEVEGHIAPTHYTIRGWRPYAEAARVVACTDVLPLTYSSTTPCYFSPLKLLEAMSVGAVPVVPDLGDLTSTVRHEGNGLVYAADDIEGLAGAIERLHQDPELRARLARSGRAHAEARSWVRVAREILDEVTPGKCA